MADVESDIKDWSTTTSSNKPTDSTTIGAGLADNLQEIQQVVKTALNSKGADIASGTITDLGATVGLYHDITGSTDIEDFGTTAAAGQWKILQFDGALDLVYDATKMILPGNANITTAAGDHCLVQCLDGTNWTVPWYTKDASPPYDYEASTWTPALKFGGAAVGISEANAGTYTKIGRFVHATCFVNLNSRGSSTGTATIEGLPYASAAGHPIRGSVEWSVMNSTLVHVSFRLADTTQVLDLYGITAANASSDDAVLDHNDFGNTSELEFEFSYITS